MNPPPIDPDEILAECLDLIERLEILLSTSEPLDPKESRKMRGMSKTRASALPSVARICDEAGLDKIGTETTAGMLQAHEEARAVRQMVVRAERVVSRLDAIRRRADHRCLSSLSTFYAALKWVARKNELLGSQLAPLEATFAQPRRTKRMARSKVAAALALVSGSR